MRDGSRNFVAKVGKVFLPEQNGDHEVCRGVHNIRSSQGTLGFSNEGHKCGQVGCE